MNSRPYPLFGRKQGLNRLRAIVMPISIGAHCIVCMASLLRSAHALEPRCNATAGTVERVFEALQNNLWSTPQNWTPEGVPTNDDHVIIPLGEVCEIDISDAEAHSFTIQTGAVLEISAGKRLTILSGSTIEGGGQLRLAGAGSTFVVGNDLTLSGEGGVFGDHEHALIAIAPGVELVNALTIEGSLEIRTLGYATAPDAGTAILGTFINKAPGQVVANSITGAALLITAPIGDSDGDWIVWGAGAALVIWAETAPLSGAFSVGPGPCLLLIARPVETTGSLTFDGGTIRVLADAWFGYGSFAGQCCNPDPGEPPFMIGPGEYPCELCD